MERVRVEELQVAMAVHRAFMRGPFSAKETATETVPHRRIQAMAAGEKPVRAWEVRHLLPALVAADPASAMAFIDDLLGLRACGIILAQAPRHDSIASDLVVEAVEAGAAVGAVQAAALSASRDGTVSTEEAQDIRSLVRTAERELAGVAAVVARSEVANPSLPGMA